MYIEKYSVENFQKFQKFQKGSKQAESAKKQPSATLFKKCGFGLDSTPHPSMEKSTLYFLKASVMEGGQNSVFSKMRCSRDCSKCISRHIYFLVIFHMFFWGTTMPALVHFPEIGIFVLGPLRGDWPGPDTVTGTRAWQYFNLLNIHQKWMNIY